MNQTAVYSDAKKASSDDEAIKADIAKRLKELQQYQGEE